MKFIVLKEYETVFKDIIKVGDVIEITKEDIIKHESIRELIKNNLLLYIE